MNEKWDQDRLDFQARMLMAYAEIEGMKASNQSKFIMFNDVPEFTLKDFNDVLVKYNINLNSVPVYQGM